VGLSTIQLRARALALLAQREHSEQELGRKLHAALLRAAERADEEPPDDAAARVQAVLAALAAQDLLSDARYMDSRLRTRAPRLGARRLAAELAQHGLKPKGETWEAVQATEAERALALLQRRFGEDPPLDLKEKARRLRFLLSRGFAPGLAAKLVEGKAA
jgi:regulatory protein